MTVDDAIAAYAALSPTEQLRVLARHAHGITIIGRFAYIPNTLDVADPRRLRVLNEVQHRVLGFISSLAAGKRPWCDDETVVQVAVGDGDRILLEEFGRALREQETGSSLIVIQ